MNGYFYSEVGISGIGEKNSISSGPDDGTNNKLANCFWRPMRHNTTEIAKNNFLAPLLLSEEDRRVLTVKSVPNLNLGGHGTDGFVETGGGNAGPFDPPNYIATWNESKWGPYLDALAGLPIAMLTIYSCDTGAGEEGADLLFAMAKRIKHAVRARTGLTMNNGQQITFQAGSTWQVATPDTRPTPIPRPPSILSLGIEPMIEFTENGVPKKLEFDHITGAEIETSASAFRQTGQNVSLLGQDAKALAHALFHSAPFTLTGNLMALVTAKITFTTDQGSTIKITLFNDRVAHIENSGVAYYCSPALRSLLHSL